MAVKLKTGVSPRVPVGIAQGPSFLYKYFKFNMIDTSTPSTGVPNAIMGVLPAYALPLETYINVSVAFANADLKIGTTADLSTVCSTADLASGTTGTYIIDRYKGTVSTSDQIFYCAAGTSGGTAGEADIWMTYLANVNPTTR